MGFKIDLDGDTLEVDDFSVTEASTPLAAGDTTGQVGQFSFSVAIPDTDAFPRVPGVPTPKNTWTNLATWGEGYFVGRDVRIFDAKKGFTLGRVDSCERSQDGGTVTFRGVSRMGSLNIFGVQAQPFNGKLRNAFNYYLGLANITTGLFVDDSIANLEVTFPGWTGELWYHLKLMASSLDCDISLVSGVILLRPIRTRIATKDRDITRGTQLSSGTLAQSVEVYAYNNRHITNQLVYPPGGWAPEVEVMNVNAGETAEYTLEMNASLSSFQQPVMDTFVSQDHSSSSIYTIVADDGYPVPPALWKDSGGTLEVSLDPDTTRLNVTLRGATNIPLATGEYASTFSVALGSDTTGNRYSTFRIVGTGVAFDKEKVTVYTGVSPSLTATEVGVTIDNPFISTQQEAYRVGYRAIPAFSGPVPTLSGTVLAINRRGDTGEATYPTYAQVRTELLSILGSGATYQDVENFTLAQGNLTYEQDRQYWFEEFRNDDADQVFGNVQGARVWDEPSRRWYRIREGNLTPAGIAISSADDDLIYGDFSGFYSGWNYSNLQAFFSGMTYEQVRAVGRYKI